MNVLTRWLTGTSHFDDTDQHVLREQMKAEDPEFRRVSQVQHDVMERLAVDRAARQLQDRWNQRVRDSWRPIEHDS